MLSSQNVSCTNMKDLSSGAQDIKKLNMWGMLVISVLGVEAA